MIHSTKNAYKQATIAYKQLLYLTIYSRHINPVNMRFL